MKSEGKKVVLVTGGSGGLGRAIAHAFARTGHRVVITARSEDKLKAAAEFLGSGGAEVLALPCDITERKQVENLAQAIQARWGNVHILFNNAGVAKAASFLDMPDSLWDEII